MTDESKNASEEASAGPVAGERLAKARRAREISIHDIAKELHLDEPKVRALEQNDFESLGAPVFAKGYLRKYAELVGVSVDDVLADYHRFDRSTGVLPILGTRPKAPRDISLGPWLAALLVIALLAGGAWFWLSGGLESLLRDQEPATLAPFAGDEAPAQGTYQAPQTTEREVETEMPVTTEPAPPGPGPAVTGPAEGEQPAVQAESAPPAALASGQVELTLQFSGDCWTEVSDASGERLYFGLGAAGRTVAVTGTAPLHVLLGDSKHATVTVDGADYPIPASARRGETARLTITRR
ncbi:MAG: helix-turn-helix domain-containing protein [Woeseiaceae bacterium]